MKKYSLIIGALLFIAGSIYAQAPTIYSIPAAFDVNEEITLYMDVTGTDLDGETGTMCFWSWSDAGDNNKNGGWGTFGNIMTKVEGKDNLYSVKVTMGTDYPAGATQIQGLVVKQDGSVQTKDSDPLLPFDFSKVASSKGMIYPSAFNASTPVSVIININGSAIDLNTAAVHMHAGLNNWSTTVAFDSDRNKTALSKVAAYEGVWRINFVVSDYFGVPENEKITNIMAVFNNGTWDQKMDDGGNDFAFVPKAGADGPTGVRFFIEQFRKNDVIPIIVNTTGLDQEDALYGYNESNLVFVIKLTGNDDYEETKRIAARKTGDNEYMIVLLPASQFENAASATAIEVTPTAGALSSSTTLTGTFVE